MTEPGDPGRSTPQAFGVALSAEGLTEEQARSHRLARKLIIPLSVFLAVLVVIILLYGFTLVEGESMLPGLRSGDRLLLTKGWETPQRDDIVVLHPKDRGAAPDIVKRVVAVGGDEVRVVGDRVWVNGAPVDVGRDVIVSDATTPSGTVVVPAGYIFVMGDNRPVSLDSRFIGMLPLSSIRGKVLAIIAPIQRVRMISSR